MAEIPSILAPEANADLVGHESAEAEFLRAWSSGRLPHAWLISGPRGVGKATLAFRIARFMLAAEQGAGSLFVAPSAPIFRKVREGAHADLRVLRRQVNERTGKLRSEIVIDDIRAAVDFLHLTPAESAWRVLIVDAADEMNRNAANALLKMLEEPKPQTLLLLLAHAPGRLLPTIRSRCRKLRLAPLAPERLGAALQANAPDLSEADRALAIALAEGSLGRALDLAGGGGIAVFRQLAAFLAEWPRFSTTALHRFAEKLAGRGAERDFDLAVELLDWWLKRCQRHLALHASPAPELFPGEAAAMRRFGEAAGLDRRLALWEKVAGLLSRVASANLDRRQAWVTAWLMIAGMAEANGEAGAR